MCLNVFIVIFAKMKYTCLLILILLIKSEWMFMHICWYCVDSLHSKYMYIVDGVVEIPAS